MHIHRHATRISQISHCVCGKNTSFRIIISESLYNNLKYYHNISGIIDLHMNFSTGNPDHTGPWESISRITPYVMSVIYAISAPLIPTYLIGLIFKCNPIPTLFVTLSSCIINIIYVTTSPLFDLCHECSNLFTPYVLAGTLSIVQTIHEL